MALSLVVARWTPFSSGLAVGATVGLVIRTSNFPGGKVVRGGRLPLFGLFLRGVEM